MALTADLLKAQNTLKELTDEQIAAIVNLSVNDENNVIGERIGRVYGDLDNDIRESFGVEKKHGEKTYDYLKRAGKSLSDKLKELKPKAEQTDALQAEINELERKLKDDKGNEVLTQKLRDAEQRFDDLKKVYDTEKTELSQKIEGLTKAQDDFKVQSEFDKGVAGLQFKPEIDESLQEILIKSAKDKVLSVYSPDFIETSDNKQVMVFRDKDGKIQHNAENKLNPFTASDLIKKELTKVLAGSKPGGGTRKPGSHSQQTVDITAAKTQVEADEIIRKNLLEEGFTRGTREFDDKHLEIRKENKVMDLPLR